MISEGLLRAYIFHNQILREHQEAVAECYLECSGYEDESLQDDMNYTLKKIKKVQEIEDRVLQELYPEV